MEFLGEIVRLQVQTTSLKVGERPHTRYDPAGIVAVPRLELESGGVNGFAADGARLDDVHHARHPRSKSRGSNAISILFTAHYDEIRGRFGDWLDDGIAGENILVRCDRHLSESEPASRHPDRVPGWGDDRSGAGHRRRSLRGVLQVRDAVSGRSTSGPDRHRRGHLPVGWDARLLRGLPGTAGVGPARRSGLRGRLSRLIAAVARTRSGRDVRRRRN